jgi:hypothetical protein
MKVDYTEYKNKNPENNSITQSVNLNTFSGFISASFSANSLLLKVKKLKLYIFASLT